MEEEFEIWKKMEPSKWERFKAQRLEKWLSPQPLGKLGLKDADKHYLDFVTDTKQYGSEKQKGGFRAQKWFSELVFDLGVLHNTEIRGYNKASAELNNYKAAHKYGSDLKITALFSSVEVKMMNYGSKQASIKMQSWLSNPCNYVAIIKACDEEYSTFKFAGWLNGYDVKELDFTPECNASLGKAFFTAYQEDLNGPRQMLRMFLQISEANPYRELSFMDNK
jgi:hypothetical protein